MYGFFLLRNTTSFWYQKKKTVPTTATQNIRSILIMRGWIFIEQPLKDLAEVMLVPTQEELFCEVEWRARFKYLLKFVVWVWSYSCNFEFSRQPPLARNKQTPDFPLVH